MTNQYMKRRDKKTRRAVKTLPLALGIFALVIVLPVFVLVSKTIQRTQQSAAGTTVSVTVVPSAVGTPIPPFFMGISSEPALSLCAKCSGKSKPEIA